MPSVTPDSSIPRRLRAEHLPSSLLGALPATPRFSWWLPEGATRQTAYQMRADGWESGWVDSTEHSLVPWDGPELECAQGVDVRVRVRTDRGESPWSDAFRWERSLSPADWQASWICPAEEPEEIPGPGHRPVYRLARGWTNPTPVLRGRLHATAHGIYEVFINGQRVGDQELTPGFSAYRHRLPVQTYDITDLVPVGDCVVEVLLSDGWYRGRHGLERRADGFGTRTGLLLQLDLEHADGSTTQVVTGRGWTSQRTGRTADLMDGERLDPPTMGLNRSADLLPDPPSALILVAPQTPPVRRVEELAALRVVQHPDGRQVADFGQCLNGWIRLDDLGPEGTRLTLTYGESLDSDGHVTTDHLSGFRLDTHEVLGAGQVDETISEPSAGRVFEPRHSTKGFRYVEIAGHPTQLRPESLTAVVVQSDLDRTGWFTCSDDRLNRLHEAAVWSLRGNLCSVPTDCPQRERSGFTGDWQIYVSTAAFLYDVAAFSRNWLADLAADQWPNGLVANVVPDPRGRGPHHDGTDLLEGSAGWGDAAAFVPWALWRAYGDPQILAESYDSMRAWVDFAAGRAANHRHPARVAARPIAESHEEYLWDIGFHFGEWLEPDAFQPPDPTVDHGEVATAFLARSAALVAQTATILGRSADAAGYQRIADGARNAWCREYLCADGTLSPRTQANHVRALAFDLVPAELRPRIVAGLVNLIRAAGGRLGTGFLSTPDLLPVLADGGRAEVATELLLSTGIPSWLGMIDCGATTIWEHWDGVGDDGLAKGSLNHYSKGGVISYLHRYVAGIQPVADPGQAEAGYRQFTVAPLPSCGLTWARARFDSIRGPIVSAWTLDGDDFQLEVEVPSGALATVRLPDGTSSQVASGRHHFRCRCDQRI